MAFDWIGVVFGLPHIFYLGVFEIHAFHKHTQLCYGLGYCNLYIASFDTLEHSVLHSDIFDK